MKVNRFRINRNSKVVVVVKEVRGKSLGSFDVIHKKVTRRCNRISKNSEMYIDFQTNGERIVKM